MCRTSRTRRFVVISLEQIKITSKDLTWTPERIKVAQDNINAIESTYEEPTKTILRSNMRTIEKIKYEPDVLCIDRPWDEHLQCPMEDIECVVDSLVASGIKVYGVTGASGAGKDTFIEAVDLDNFRFGDSMKDIAYRLGMTPYSREYCEQNREARFIQLPCGKNSLEAWISLDFLREWNPFVFISPSLERVYDRMCSGPRPWNNPRHAPKAIVFSGMRTEVGLETVQKLVTDTGGKYIHIEREDHEPPKEAIMDKLQIAWPVDEVVHNDLDSLGAWKTKANMWWHKELRI